MDQQDNQNIIGILLTGHKHILPKGQVVNNVGDTLGVSLLKKGYIKRYLIRKDGSQSIQLIFGPGDVFPLTPIYKLVADLDVYVGEEFIYYEAMNDVEIWSISLGSFKQLLDNDPGLYRDLFIMSGQRIRSNIQRLENMSLGDSYSRLVHQILFFALKFGKPDRGGIVLDIPLTHSDLAGVLNLARETVSRSIAQLHRKGLVANTKNLFIPDIERLKKEL